MVQKQGLHKGKLYLQKKRDLQQRTVRGKLKEKARKTDENSEMISKNPSPISACEVSMLRVVLFDSTQTQGSSKYFLLSEKETKKQILLK